MKRLLLSISMTGVVALSCFAQGSATFTASTSNFDRVALVKSNVEFNAWQERDFWPMYEKFVASVEDLSVASNRTLSQFAGLKKSASNDEASETTTAMLEQRNKLMTLRKSIYHELANTFNGVIAFQVLQNEVLLEMMESSLVYDGTRWKGYRFYHQTMPIKEFKKAKANTITKALSLSKEEADIFWPLYEDYEAECNAQLGANYNMISLFAVEPTDFTPALSKRLGHQLIDILEREEKLKQRYFSKISDQAGANLASRFLAWEDYYSLVCKMNVWLDEMN